MPYISRGQASLKSNKRSNGVVEPAGGPGKQSYNDNMKQEIDEAMNREIMWEIDCEWLWIMTYWWLLMTIDENLRATKRVSFK